MQAGGHRRRGSSASSATIAVIGRALFHPCPRLSLAHTGAHRRSAEGRQSRAAGRLHTHGPRQRSPRTEVCRTVLQRRTCASGSRLKDERQREQRDRRRTRCVLRQWRLRAVISVAGARETDRGQWCDSCAVSAVIRRVAALSDDGDEASAQWSASLFPLRTRTRQDIRKRTTVGEEAAGHTATMGPSSVQWEAAPMACTDRRVAEHQ